jgi:SpoVK/Ycf46/Vps4 family AAA+-type ATPase
MFNYARDHQPCIIFMDEIDAIGGRRFSEGTSADREIQRYANRFILVNAFLNIAQLVIYFKDFKSLKITERSVKLETELRVKIS